MTCEQLISEKQNQEIWIKCDCMALTKNINSMVNLMKLQICNFFFPKYSLQEDKEVKRKC